MKINSFLTGLLVLVFLTTAAPSMASARPAPPLTENTEAEVTRLTNRLEEIKSIDKTKLSRTEKKALRGEVKAIKKELAAVSGGVYLSIGAILLIALLLILLL